MFDSNSVQVNPEQKCILFDAMSRNSHVLESRSLSLRSAKNNLWEKLAQKLNKHGAVKSTAQWKKCWTDLRLAMKRKNGIEKKKVLTDYEKGFLKRCGLRTNAKNHTSQNASGFVEVVGAVDEIIQNKPDESVCGEFEMVSVTSEEITNYQKLIKGAIEIEDEPPSPKDSGSLSESLFLSEEPSSYLPPSISNLQEDPPTFVSACERKCYHEDVMIEIQKMHRNLLTQSIRQTALLEKIANSLAP